MVHGWWKKKTKQNKQTCVSTNKPKKIRVGRSENIFNFFVLTFFLLEKDQKHLYGLNIINNTWKHTYNEVYNNSHLES